MKDNTLYASLLAGNADEAGLIDAWLDERSIDLEQRRTLMPNDIVSTWLDEKQLSESSGSYDDEIDAGQIRILSKRFTEDDNAIPYVVVLEKWQDDMWLIAPFSHYSYPATPGEMTTGIRNVGLRVIQAWNGRTVQVEVLSKSFLFGQLDEKVRSEAAALFRNQLANTELPADFSALRGPAIIMDADPRCDYQAEAIARLQPLSTAVHAQERLRTIDLGTIRSALVSAIGSQSGFWRPRYAETAYALAAGEKGGPQTEVFSVEETELSVTYSPEDQMTTFTFYDCDNEPDPAYDGYGLVGAGEFLGTFHNGRLRVPSASVKDWYQIVNREGREVVLARKRNESDR